ncbi:MAG: hypothetical protein AMK71_04005 [Nitrospira bacterium SG8_35_4]|nr:MAG: hypothetical protein AMK71_04005 [Nitrospira bacterium SG8_35_4]
MKEEKDNTRLLRAEIRRLRKIIDEITPPLDVMLKQRGFTIYKKEPSGDLLIPDQKFASVFRSKLKKYSFRLFLRDVIQHQNSFDLDQVTRFATKQVAAGYLDSLLASGIVEPYHGRFRLVKRPLKSFGETLEWYVAGLIREDFQTEAVWGVKFKRPKIGGDYDVIAKLDSSLLYMEIKSSPPRQIFDRGITAFLDRVEELSPEISIYFMDTELRMKDKIVPMFEEELLRRYKKQVPVTRIVKELFHINKKIFIINAKGGISSNINTVFTFLWHKKFEID